MAFVNGWNNGLVPVLPGNTFGTGAATSWQALATLNYQLLKTANLFMSGGHLIVPTSDGHLQKTTTRGLRHHPRYQCLVGYFPVNYAHTAANTNLLTSDADFFCDGRLLISWPAIGIQLSPTLIGCATITRGRRNRHCVLLTLTISILKATPRCLTRSSRSARSSANSAPSAILPTFR